MRTLAWTLPRRTKIAGLELRDRNPIGKATRGARPNWVLPGEPARQVRDCLLFQGAKLGPCSDG